MQAHGGMTRSATRLAGLVVGAALVLGCGSNDGKLKVNGLEPRTGDAMGGQIVQINGQNFMKTTRTVKVYFGDQIGNFIRFKSDTEMVVEAPGGKPDSTVDVLVVFQPGGEITIPKAFTFKEKKGMDADDLEKK